MTVKTLSETPPDIENRYWSAMKFCFYAALPLLSTMLLLFPLLGNDEAVAAFFHPVNSASPLLAKYIDLFSDYAIVPFYLAYAWILFNSLRTRRNEGVRFVLIYILTLILLLMLVDVLKVWISRPRPGQVEDFVQFSLSQDQHSFPSGHTVKAVFTALLLAERFRNRALSIFSAVWIALIGLSRVYLGYHYPTDVIAGVVPAFAAILLHVWIMRFFHAKAFR